MPQSTALPPQQVEIIDRWSFPATSKTQTDGSSITFDFQKVRYSLVTDGNISSPAIGGIGGAGTTQVRKGPGTRMAVGVDANGALASLGAGFFQSIPHAPFGPAADFNPGAILEPSSVVQVYNFHFCVDAAGAAAPWPDDITGLAFIPFRFGVTFVNNFRVGTAPQPGFGIFMNDDGGGATVPEYVAWSAAGATLERVNLAAQVPDVEAWSTARFILVGATSGREASMRLIVNGTEVLAGGRQFGSASLLRPDATDPLATYYCAGFGINGAAGPELIFCMDGWNGRFTPEGEEIQSLA